MTSIRNRLASTWISPIVNADQAFLDNPYPMLKELREKAPIWWCAEQKYWLISRYSDVQEILRSQHFEKQIQRWKHAPNGILLNLVPHLKSLRKTSSNWLLNLNPPSHTRVRNLVNKAFTPSVVQKLRPRIEQFANELLDVAASMEQPIDIITSLTFPLPLAIIGEMLGVPVEQKESLRNWSGKLAATAGGQRNLKVVMAAGEAVEELENYLRPAIEERRNKPQDDLLSVLVQAEESGTQLSTDELIANCILLLVAGHETTTNLIANAIHQLLKHPDQLAKLKAQPDLMPNALAEVLRFDGPAQIVPRLAAQDKQWHGHKIKTGDMLWLLLGSANRDPQEFDAPDRFEITRTRNKQLGFSEGIHRCVGASLAEVEAGITLSVLLQRFPSLKLASEEVHYKAPFPIRGPKQLMVSLK